MKVGDVMTPDADVVIPGDTLRTAARLMAQLDFAALLVDEDDRLAGIITSHDIATRIVAEAGDPETITVRQAMSTDVLDCFAEENVDEVLEKMDSWWVRRLRVVSQDKPLLGIVSLGELAPAKSPPRDFGGGAVS